MFSRATTLSSTALASCLVLWAMLLPQGRAGLAMKAAGEPSRLSVSELRHYTDLLYGFEIAVPQGWARIIADADLPSAGAYELGYAVGFESPRTHPEDNYADYLMIEVLPGSDTGAFQTTGEDREAITIDGLAATRDRLVVDAVPFENETLSLLVFQADIQGTAFRIGLYAIGQPHEAQALGDAFEIMLETFHLREQPFTAF